jgi:hypothetical protein
MYENGFEIKPAASSEVASANGSGTDDAEPRFSS